MAISKFFFKTKLGWDVVLKKYNLLEPLTSAQRRCLILIGSHTLTERQKERYCPNKIINELMALRLIEYNYRTELDCNLFNYHQKKKSFPKKNISSSLAVLLGSLTISNLHASVVRSDIDYQLFRDFAENKGQFYVGASDIIINNHEGDYVGTMLENIPMIDFSAVNSINGVAVLIDPQYMMSVRHNGGYQSVTFGANTKNSDNHTYTYKIVDRNNYNEKNPDRNKDYHTPRLNKLVTEVVPIQTTYDGVGSTKGNLNAYLDKNKYPLFVRVGSGAQNLQDVWVNDGNVEVPSAQADIANVRYGINGFGIYAALTGGEALEVKSAGDHQIYLRTEDLYDESSPMLSYGLGGDSGSGLFAYDAEKKEWVYVGTYSGYSGDGGNPQAWYQVVDLTFNQQVFDEDIQATLQSGDYVWDDASVENGTSQLINTQDNQNIDVDINTTQYDQYSNAQNTNNNTSTQNINVPYSNDNTKTVVSSSKRLENNGKNLIFNGSGTLTLNESIDQGAGSLTFNGDYVVDAISNDITHLGAGIIVNQDAHVSWAVKNPLGDRLSKIGSGTLEINGVGVNTGDISVGDGTVILNQSADENGLKQAFDTVGIVSGRSTVVLNDAQQLDANNIYFGYRGGRLDVNGNDISFNVIQNVDDGAQIVNHSTNAANVLIQGVKNITEQDIPNGTWGSSSTGIYKYNVQWWYPHGSWTDYYRLVEGGDPKQYLPADGSSNDNWIYLGGYAPNSTEEQKSAAMKSVIGNYLDYYNQPKITAFSGMLGENDSSKTNGELNIEYKPTRAGSTLLLNGGSNVNGALSITDGVVVLTGRPTPYATGKLTVNEDIDNTSQQATEGAKYKYALGVENVYDDDWIDREFSFDQINLDNNSILDVGRNVSKLTSDINITDNGILNLGITEDSVSYIRSDVTGQVRINEKITEEGFNSTPTTAVNGNISLKDNAIANINKVSLDGDISTEKNTTVNYQYNQDINSKITGDGNLIVSNNAHVTLKDKGGVDDSIKVNIAENSQFEIENRLEFNNLLNGSGTLKVVNNKQSVFNFGANVDNNFLGTLDLNNAIITLNDKNSNVLIKADIVLSRGSEVLVGNNDRSLQGIDLKGGKLDFNVSGTDAIGKLHVEKLNFDSGSINIISTDLSNNSGLFNNINGDIFEQAKGSSLFSLITSEKPVTGDISQISFTVNDSKNTSQTSDVIQNNKKVAIGTYNYGLSKGDDKGAYVKYGLSELELLTDGTDALSLQTNDENKTLDTVLKGKGGIKIDAHQASITLANSKNSYTGTTLVNSGILNLTVDNALGKTSLLTIQSNATVKTNGKAQTVGYLNNSGSLILDTVATTNAVLNLELGGRISEENGISGTGQLNINGGTLDIEKDNNELSGSINIAENATVVVSSKGGLGSTEISNAGELHLNKIQGNLTNNISGSSTSNISFNKDTDIILTGDNTQYSGSLTTDLTSTLQVGNAKNLGSSTINNGGSIVFDNNDYWDMLNKIQGQGQIVKDGIGILSIKDNDVKTSHLTINNGAVYLNNSVGNTSLLNGNVEINNKGTLVGGGTVVGNVTNTGNLIVAKDLKNDDFDSLTIAGDYIGKGGVINLSTALGGDKSETDRLLIQGDTSGTSFVHVDNVGGTGDQTIDGIKIIEVNGMSNGLFALDSRVVGGAYEYTLFKADGDWSLRSQKEKLRPESSSYITNSLAANEMFVSDLNGRRGNAQDLAKVAGEANNSSMWIMSKSGEVSFENENKTLKTKDKRYVFQVGLDVLEGGTTEQNLWRIGTMVGLGNSSNSTRSNVTGYESNGVVKGYNFGLYGTWFENFEELSGAYIDSVIQHSWFKNTVSGDDTQQESYSSKGLTASLETGYAFNISKQENKKYFIQPKIQAILQNIKFDDFKENNGTRVEQLNKNNLQTRLGVKAFVNMNSNSSNGLNRMIPFVEMSWIHNTHDYGVQLNQDTVKQGINKNSYEVKIGTNGQINDQLSIWGTLDHQFGEKSYKNTSVMIGAKYSF